MFGSELWGPLPMTGDHKKAREQLAAAHLTMLKLISGLRKTAPTAIVYRELDAVPLQDMWLLSAARFWNTLLGATGLHKTLLLDAVRLAVAGRRNWVSGLVASLSAAGCPLNIQAGELVQVDMPCLAQRLSTLRAAPWLGLHDSPRLAPSEGAKLCTYLRWFARPERCQQRVTMIPASARVVRRFLCFRVGCHGLPRETGAWAGTQRQDRLCVLCHSGPGDERHLVFECQQLQDIRLQHPALFVGVASMLDFMWQPDMRAVAVFVDKCLTRFADASAGDIQPGSAGVALPG